MTRRARPKGVCVHCKARAIRGGSMLCEPCTALARSEGTYEQLAQPNFFERKAAERRDTIKKYNALLRKGVRPVQVAKLWGWDIKALANYVYRAKAAGFDVINYDTIRHGQPQEPKTPIRVSITGNDHGGGAFGVRGCKCEPCLTHRRARWRADDAIRRQRRKEQQQDKPS